GFHGFPRRHGPPPSQEHPPGAGEGRARRGHVPGAARRRGQRDRSRPHACLLPRDLRRLRQLAGADPRVPAPSGRHHAARTGAGACRPRRRSHCRRAVPARTRHAVWTLLGRRAPAARAALRDLLLPGHRVLPARRAFALRARRPGRAQDRARLPADGGAQPPLDRRTRLPPGTCGVVPAGGSRGRRHDAGAGTALAVPRRVGCHVSRTLPVLLAADPGAPFPDPATALREPDGLLAVGGDLAPARLLTAYANGIFPWYSEGQPLLWWSPDPRTVFNTDGVYLSSRFRRQLRGSDWSVVADRTFDEVVHACATAARGDGHGTWITDAMREAYSA